jgi:hypothetical protein
MSPFETAGDMYRRHPQDCPFERYLHWYLQHGFVYSTPDFFIMGRPVHLCADRKLITEDFHIFDPDDCDAWYIFAMAGSIHRAWSILPWPLPWLCWERLVNGERDFRAYLLEDVRRVSNLVVNEAHEAAFP